MAHGNYGTIRFFQWLLKVRNDLHRVHRKTANAQDKVKIVWAYFLENSGINYLEFTKNLQEGNKKNHQKARLQYYYYQTFL
jgi:hypothetical protein